MSTGDGCQINYRCGGEQEGDKEKGAMKMGNGEGHRKKNMAKNKEGWDIIAFGVTEWEHGWRGKKPHMLINNTLYNSKGTQGLSFPKQGTEDVCIYIKTLSTGRHTCHSQIKSLLIFFLCKSFEVLHLYMEGLFKDECLYVSCDKQKEKIEGRTR